MTDVFVTAILAAILIVIALALLSVGWFLTGKNRIIKGCGRVPDMEAKNGKECGKGPCSICRPENEGPKPPPSDKDA